MSIHFLGIIRMEREGVEKSGVEGPAVASGMQNAQLMSGVQGMGRRGKAEKLE